MAGRLFRKIWQALNTDMELSETLTGGVGAGRSVLELTDALQKNQNLKELKPILDKIDSVIDALNLPLGEISKETAPFLPIATSILKYVVEETGAELTLPDSVELVSQAAYLESLSKFLRDRPEINFALQEKEASTELGRYVQKFAKKLKFDDNRARETLICFHESLLARELNKVLQARLVESGLESNLAATVTERVSRSTHRYMKEVVAAVKDDAKQLAGIYEDIARFIGGANLTRANLRGTNFTDANLNGVNFYNADLTGANVSHAQFYRACLYDTKFSDLDFRAAELSNFRYGINFSNLSGADLSNIKWSNTTAWSNVIGLHEAKEVPEALKQEPEFAAAVVLSRGHAWAKEGKIDEAIASYREAQTINPQLEISANFWSHLCWYGCSYNCAAEVLFAGEKAVELEPNGDKEARGIARALTGDVAGAIADFQATLDSLGYCDNTKLDRLLRWLEALRRGENPFTPE